ncbi:MAG: phytanoyl-CoA dioxygenase family protein, partial [Telluria sp.]
GLVAVQCTWFEKSAARNWLVPMHQDLSIPVAASVDDSSLCGWSLKEGIQFVHAPLEILEKLVAVRIHLDPCGPDDGPLRVVPGSHTHGVLSDDQAADLRLASGETVCVAPVGAALVMRPLLLHASSKGSGASARRVLHFVFGPRELPNGLRWNMAI